MIRVCKWEDGMRRLAMLVFTGLLTVAPATPTFAATPVEETARQLSALDADVARLEGWIDPESRKLRDAATAAEVEATARRVADGYAAAVATARGVPPAERGAAAFRAVIQQSNRVRKALIFSGLALPGAFLSADGKARAPGIQQQIDRAVELVRGLTPSVPNASGRAHDARNAHQRALRGMGQLSKADLQTPSGMAMLEQLKFVEQQLAAFDAAGAQQQQVAGEAKAFCAELAKTYWSGDRARWLAALYGLASGQGSNRSYTLNEAGIAAWTADLRGTMATLQELAPICADAARAPLLQACKPTHGKPRMEGLYAENDPVNWCSYVPRAKALLQQEIEDALQRNGEITARVAGGGNTAEELERREGWLGQDGLGRWADLFTFGKAQQEAAIAPFRTLLQTIGADLTNPERVFAKRVAAMQALEAEVRRLAPKWSRPPTGERYYGEQLARKQVQRVYGKVQIVATGGGSPAWSVKKNALGIPLYRDRGGWVLFLVPGEPLCQLHTFITSETFDGRGYQKDAAVHFGGLRWQGCR